VNVAENSVEKGPLYGVPLIKTLPMQPGKGGGARQLMPTEADLRAIVQDHCRVVAGYEVLLAHFHRLRQLLPELGDLLEAYDDDSEG
jgi:hypothetical protein